MRISISEAIYTVYARADILALQPAPIQIQFLGYPNTLGADFIQYAIADKWLISDELAAYYTEKIIYLPHADFGSPVAISETKLTADYLARYQVTDLFLGENIGFVRYEAVKR